MAVLEQVKSASLVELIQLVLHHKQLRHLALNYLKKKSHKALIEEDPYQLSRHTREGRYHLVCGLLDAVVRGVEEGLIGPNVQRVLTRNFVDALVQQDRDEHRQHFIEQHGFEPPLHLVISPEGSCNLNCYGCYANSTARLNRLEYSIADRIMQEKRELWGSRFTVISGGEPLMWRSQGKSILDLIAQHHDNAYLMYTNGVLITKEVAQRMAEVGNISPALSVEGFERETDQRRGEGVFRRILAAMANLREAGVPFGISITATRQNADIILSDEMVDFYIHQQGALYVWIFQYMPIGRRVTLDLQVTPEQRVRMLKRNERLVWEHDLFIVDFWNSGPYTYGCIAGAREGGYLYIDWNGNVAPCVFFPYANDNIHDIYTNGGTLNDVLFSPLFRKLRGWQRNYGFLTGDHKEGNQLVPCPYRDHHDFAYRAIMESGAQPLDDSGARALADTAYHQGLITYGEQVHELMQPIWEHDFLRLAERRSQKP